MKGSASLPSSATMNGTRCFIGRPRMPRPEEVDRSLASIGTLVGQCRVPFEQLLPLGSNCRVFSSEFAGLFLSDWVFATGEAPARPLSL
jgi:hypothetical protein